MKDAIQKVTNAIIERSQKPRAAYLDMLKQTQDKSPARGCLSCSNMAHVVAASPDDEKTPIAQGAGVNIGIVTAYNDMLSAHQPLATYPDFIKEKARSLGATAQVAGGVPAMCDGVTQGLPGMELSLFSRDVIAMSTAISLTHNVFDAVACLGVCDKIVPGMIIGALQFGHLPAVFIPAGPMVSGISNAEKARVRQQFAAGEVDELALMDAETASYHSAGTCTFYGTANANQLLMEMLGVQLPSTSFINTGTPLRDALTASSVEQVINMASKKIGLSSVVTEKSMVNALVGLLATGGSTNHTLHLLAIARAAGIIVTWDDFNNLSRAVPLLARVYPNGTADVNQTSKIFWQNIFASGTLSFDVKVSSESCCDRFSLLVDGTEVVNSVSSDWQRLSTELSSGQHIIEFRYQKDGSVSYGDDAVWVDNITFESN